MTQKKILYIANGNSIHDVKWMCYFSEQSDKYSCFLLGDALNPLSKDAKDQLERLKIKVLPPIQPISISHPLKTIRAIIYYKKLIRSLQPDFVHVLFAAPNALWLNFANTPSIITMRGSDILLVIPDLQKATGLRSIYFSFLYRQFKKAFLKSKAVTGTSYSQLEKAEELFVGSKLKLIRTGVDVEKIEQLEKEPLIPDALKNTPFVFSPRFMAPIYNIEFQIETMALLDASILQSYTFVFIRGKQYNETYYQRQLKRLAELKATLQINYLVIDYVTQEEMWMILKKASLCIMTPISDGTPNSALEAMSAKCPIILSNLDYDKDLFENTCIQLNTFDTNELKESIELALRNYDSSLLAVAYDSVKTLGNRSVEMKKLGEIYASIN